MKKVLKILIIKTSSMGDIINTLPAITDATQALPKAEFDWIIEKRFSEIPTWHPKIKKTFTTNFRLWKEKYYSYLSYTSYFKFIQKLKNKKYDFIIDAQGLIKSAFFIACFTKGEKHGMDYKSIREPIATLCYNKRHTIPKKQHNVERIRQLFSYSLQYPLPKNKGQHCISQNFKTINPINPYLIFLYNTTKSNKHWPESNWRNLIKNAINFNYKIKLPYWSKNEQLRTKRLIHGLHLHNNNIEILHHVTLTEMAKQIASAYAVISIDTGLSHLTAALSCPILTLYGPTDPTLTGTYGNHLQFVIYSKTKKMSNITTEQVWNKFITLLHKKHTSKT